MKTPDHLTAWNQAHERLHWYLETFALGDEIHVTRLALRLLDEARALHRADPSRDPTDVTLRHAQDELTRWLARQIDSPEQRATPGLAGSTLAGGTIALLLSGLTQERPETFLAEPAEPDVQDLLRRTLVVTGPDLTISSMTPRRFDYGPMLGLARQTWHRWDTKTFATALLFWLGVYGICYWCLTEYL
jgi:hypothetical protein